MGFKILAQSAVSQTASFAETLYTCPSSGGEEFASRHIFQTLVSSIVVCNRNAATKTYSIKVVPSGETSADKHILFNDRPLVTDGTEVLSMGMGLQPGDRVMVHAESTSSISMTMFGIEMV
jgi:hypothetical protein